MEEKVYSLPVVILYAVIAFVVGIVLSKPVLIGVRYIYRKIVGVITTKIGEKIDAVKSTVTEGIKK